MKTSKIMISKECLCKNKQLFKLLNDLLWKNRVLLVKETETHLIYKGDSVSVNALDNCFNMSERVL